MMAAQILTQRGRSLGSKYCSSLPKLTANRITSPLCYFSTNPNVEADTANNSDGTPSKSHSQSFVQSDIHLELGELETEIPAGYHQNHGKIGKNYSHAKDGRDSYWRPPWKNPRAEIISAEDFANRPRVTFSESFLTMNDGMVVLTWMTQEDKDGMYKLYLEMMTAIAGQSKDAKKETWGVLSTNTSHEYVVRVVAQKYNVTSSRAAGVIQLQHNEEQCKKDPDFKVNHALQAHMDTTIREHIREVYQSYGEKDPLQFVEDPIASTGRIGREDTSSEMYQIASELTDVDALLKKTKMMELEAAKVRIKNHIYVEDVDERTRKVKVDQETKRLLKMGDQLNGFYEEKDEEGAAEDEPEEEETPVKSANSENDKKSVAKSNKRPKKRRIKVPPNLKIPVGASPYPDNNRGYDEVPETRRPRWKFAAQIINTKMLETSPDSSSHGRKFAARAKGRRHGRVVDGNTIIEQEGKLRVASVAELEQTSWKHVRNESEFMFKGVKESWLKRQLEGEVGGWGMQEEVLKLEPQAAPEMIEGKEEGEEKGEGEESAGTDETVVSAKE